MQISAGADGIQRLLAAEQEAQAIVTKARKAKADRLKQAKAEADREIKAYKTERENLYQKRIQEDSSSSGENVRRLEAESAQEVRRIEQAVAAKKQELLDWLLSLVTTVKLTK
ncbi:hypothetical protein WJX72_000656 [[Myrmecia] bisecta]|uniref:V-type proton ATPase subunit G n=1 Tax=[Myrmecia] bisecta TaxID=41462 RepID=A0AAW1R3J9_9CHLO